MLHSDLLLVAAGIIGPIQLWVGQGKVKVEPVKHLALLTISFLGCQSQLTMVFCDKCNCTLNETQALSNLTGNPLSLKLL